MGPAVWRSLEAIALLLSKPQSHIHVNVCVYTIIKSTVQSIFGLHCFVSDHIHVYMYMYGSIQLVHYKLHRVLVHTMGAT